MHKTTTAYNGETAMQFITDGGITDRAGSYFPALSTESSAVHQTYC